MKCFNKQLQTCLKQMKKVSVKKQKIYRQSNGNLRTEKYKIQNKKLPGWAQQEKGVDIGKN